MDKKIFVVIPVFNRLVFTKKCLRSIYNQSYKNYQVILIDDGSTDGTEKYVTMKFPKTKIIKGDGNWWWTKSIHEGIKHAMQKAKVSDFILLMNNDLYFDKDYFKNLLKTSIKYKNSIIGSICVRSQNQKEVVEAGVRIDWPTGLVYGVAQTISKDINYYKKMEVIDNIDALPGKGTLVPVSVFKKGIQFKYRLFPHYIADYEFAINAKRNGYNLLVSTKSIAKHYWEATGISGKASDKRISYSRAISLLFGRKSMNNILDWINFINTSCPNEYKYRNYYYSFLKIIKAILSVFPFYYLLPVINNMAKIYHAISLFTYRTKIKIKQFPNVYLKIK